MGIYRHYKGGLYQVLSLAHDANHDDRTVVFYMPLQLEAAHLGPRPAVRTFEDFVVTVHVSAAEDNWPACFNINECPRVKRNDDGGIDLWDFDQTHRPRFEFLGSVLTPDMLPQPTVL